MQRLKMVFIGFRGFLFLTAFITLYLISASGGYSWAGTLKGQIKAQRGIRHLEYTLVYIERVEGKKFPSPVEHKVMDQKGMVFVPHILPILIGQTVDFHNSDNLRHNIFTPDKIADSFNLGTYGKDTVRPWTFKRTGDVVVLCNIHAEMEAYIIVLENPYFTLADSKGGFFIANVPAGTYPLKAWHKDAESERIEVSVPETGEVEVTLNLMRRKGK